MLEIERIVCPVAVKGTIVNQSDNYACRQLSRKQLLVVDIAIILRNGKRLAYDPFHRILGSAILQRLGMCQKQGW